MMKWLLALLMVLQLMATAWAKKEYDSQDFISSHTLECVARLGGAGDWVIIKNRVYLFQVNQIIILDMSGEKTREINRVRLAGPYASYAIKYPALYVSCGDFAYTRDSATIQLFDLNDVNHPKHVKDFGNSRRAAMLKLDSRYLEESGHFWNIEAPLNPVQVYYEDDVSAGKIGDLKSNDGERIVSNAAKTSETYFNSFADRGTTVTSRLKSWVGPNCVGKIVITNEQCFMTSGTYLCSVDIHDPMHPKIYNTLDLKTELLDIGKIPGNLYALGMDAKLHIVSLNDLLHPVEIEVVSLPGKGIKLEALDSRAFIITASHYDETSRYRHENLVGDTIIALDCSDPRHPIPAGKLKLPCEDLLADGIRLFVAANKLLVVDTTDLLNLTIKAQSKLSIPTPAPGEPEEPQVNAAAVQSDLARLNGLVLGLSPLCFHEAKDYSYGCINCYTSNQFATPTMTHQLTGPQFRGLWSDGKSLYTKTSYSATGMRMNVLMQARLDEKLNLIPIAGNLDFGEINDIAFYKDYILVADEYGLAILKKH